MYSIRIRHGVILSRDDAHDGDTCAQDLGEGLPSSPEKSETAAAVGAGGGLRGGGEDKLFDPSRYFEAKSFCHNSDKSPASRWSKKRSGPSIVAVREPGESPTNIASNPRRIGATSCSRARRNAPPQLRCLCKGVVRPGTNSVAALIWTTVRQW